MIETLLSGFGAGIISNFLILYWFEKEIPGFFQNERINKNVNKISLYISLVFMSITYLLIVLLIHWYSKDFSISLIETVKGVQWFNVFIEVFFLSFLLLGGRSLLYSKLVLNLNNIKLKVGSYD